MKIATYQQDSALVLIVDDDKFMRLQLRRAMEQAGYQVAEASDGQEALAAYTRLHPDMVLLDAIMPVMDGFTCCRQLKTLPGGDRTPVLMITVLEEQESVELAFDAGAADFINKPIHWEVLRQRVRRLLQASRTMKELQQQIERAQLGEERLSLALDAAHMGTWDWDILTNKVSYSHNLGLIFGLSPSSEHPTYEAFLNTVHPEDRDRVTQAVLRAVEDGADYGLEFRVILPDGTVRWIEDRGQVYYDNTSKPIRMVGATMDITERQQAEEELRQSEEFLRRIIKSSPDCIKVLDLEGRLLYMSAGGQSLLEIDRFSAVINSQWVDFWQETHNQAARAAIETAKAGGIGKFQGYCPTAKGTPKWWEVVVTALLDAEGKPEKLLLVSRDITERQRLEAIARIREQELSDFVENASVGMHWVGADGQILWANQAELDLLGYSREEYIGQPITKFHADREVIDDILQRLNANETLHDYEARLLSKDGSIKQVLINSNVFWKDGRFIHTRCFTRDITERKRLEEALQQQTERERLVVEIAQHIRQSLNLGEILSTTVSEVRQFLQVDRVFIYRFEPDWSGVVVVESVGSDWEPILHKRLTDPHFANYVQPYKQGRIQATADVYAGGLTQCYVDFLAQFQVRATLVVPILQGEELWGLLTSNQCSAPRQWQQLEIDLLKQLATQLAIAIQQSTLFEQVQAELVERQQAEEELQRQNLRSQLFADITLKIRQSLQIEEILQATVTEVQKLLQADRVLIFRLHSNGYGQIVTESVVPGWPSVLGRGITDECFGAEYLKKYSQGRIYTIADVEKAGVQPCLVEFMQQFGVKAKLVMPILFKEELWGLLVAHQCSSPRQWSSFEVDLLRQIADQIGIALIQAQRLEEETRQRQEVDRSNAELQQFASIASHDLQEPLRKIQAFGNRLKVTCGESLNEQGRDYLERMQNAAQRMQALIDDLLILSRITTRVQPFLSVDLAQVTQEVLSDLEVQLQQTNGRVEVGELPTVKADPVQMRQLLQNLISNALKFHRDGEPPVVKISSQFLNQQLQPVEDAIAEFYQIVVTDNGIGFDEKYLDRIFNVFQRLHGRSEYEGTGMGLAICRKIAERHGGSITAESTPGEGATFIVTLPTKQPRGEHPA